MGLLTALIHRFVEQPLRRSQAAPWRQGLAFMTVVIVCSLLTHLTFKASGLRMRLPAAQLARFDMQRFGMDTCTNTGEKSCAFGDLAGGRMLTLLGDSYVQQYVAALDGPLKSRDIRGDTSTVGGCLMLTDATTSGPRARECAALRDSEIARIKASSADFVAIGQAWQLYLDRGDPAAQLSQERIIHDGLAATIRDLQRPGRHFLVIGAQVRPVQCAFDQVRMQPGPLWHAPPQPCEAVSKAQAVTTAGGIDALLLDALQPFPNAELLRPLEVYCDLTCPVVEDGVWLFLDPGHFTVAGSERMGRRANALIASFLDQPLKAARHPHGP